VEIQRQIVAAWTTWAEGRQEEALKQLRAAADLEDATEKHPVTPGPIVPARELLGEMLLEMKRPSQALAEFEAVLERSPNRLRALYGAARAAREAGDRLRARHFYTKLVELAKTGDGERPELREAEQFLAEYAKA
jgi:tetratricopeptide (TPR) repeat protein